MAKKKKDDEEQQPEESSGGSIAVNDAWTGLLAISLLALIVGTGFLAYDYMQYYDEKMPTVPKLTGTPPGTPPGNAKPEVGGGPKDADKKDADKKDAAP